MSKYGKWIGLGLGWAFGGPIGGILGLAVGSMFDYSGSSDADAGAATATAPGHTRRGDYAASLLVLVAAVMKADGKVMKSELEYVRNFFRSRFGSETASEAMIMLRDILKQEIPLRDVSRQMSQRLDYSSRLEMIHFLFGIAAADADVSEAEKQIISAIAGYMEVSSGDYESILAMFTGRSDAAYRILEIEPTATDDEVKKAYREMAKKYHPDKVGYLGDDFKKVAHEKFQKVQDAYDKICKERGIK
ncbi:MAG: TerB family tellurite resistance protein [Bacteroidota bacterium]